MSGLGVNRDIGARDPVARFVKPFEAPRYRDPARAPDGKMCWLWAKDTNGIYRLPFPCIRIDGIWFTCPSHKRVMVEIAGWGPA